MSNPEDLLYARIRADLERERGLLAWLRSRPTPVRALLLVGGAGAAVGAALLALGPAGFEAATGWSVAALTMTTLAAFAAAIQPVHHATWTGAPRRLLISGVLIGALAAIALGGDGTIGELADGHCLLGTAMMGAPVFALALAVGRGSGRYLVPALAAALSGAVAIQLVCPSPPGLLHLVLEHFGAVLLTAGVFAMSAAAVSRLRDARAAE